VDDQRIEPSPLPSPERLAYLVTGDLEEDDIGLWEIVWRLNGSHPAVSLPDKVRLARQAVSLLGDHTVLWLGDPLEPDSRPLSSTELNALADDESAWHDPNNATMVVWLRPIR
jgi:hypothetical protein